MKPAKPQTMEEKDAKIKELILLLIEARDALPAITMTAAKLRGLSLTLADRIKDCLAPWEVDRDDPNGI